MKFEGEHRIIELRGIERAGADSIQQAGGLEQCVGLEAKNGSLVPYAMSIKGFRNQFNTSTVQSVLVHKTNSCVNIIFITKSDSSYSVIYTDKDRFDNVQSVDAKTILTTDEEIGDICQMGQMLCISFDSGMKYFLWNGNDYVEKYNSNYKVPIVRFKVDRGLYSSDVADTDEKYGVYNANSITLDYEHRKTIDALSQSHIIKCLGIAREKGGLTGYALVCAVWRLRNGDFVNAGPILLICPPNVIDGDKLKDLSGNYDVLDNVYANGYSDIKYGKEMFLKPYSGNNDDLTTGWKLKEENGFVEDKNDRFIAYTTWKAEDGSYTKLGPILYNGGAIILRSPQFMATCYNYSEDEEIYYAKIYSTLITNKLMFSVDDITNINDEIVSLNIFLSTEISAYYNQTELSNIQIESFSGIDDKKHIYNACTLYPKQRPIEDIISDIREINNLYKVAEYSIQELTANTYKNIDLKGKLGDNLVVRERMPLTAWEKTNDLTGQLFNYNMRLHIFNFQKKLFDGYTKAYYEYNGGLGQYYNSTSPSFLDLNYEIDVTISDSTSGESKIVKYETGLRSTITKLNPLIFFPNVNATNICIRLSTNAGRYKIIDLPLKRCEALQCAYYINPTLLPVDIEMQEPYSNSFIIPVETSKNTIRHIKNGIMVSDIAYPNYFPTELTYRIGNGEIIGLATLSNALSQDLYGPQPLLVFCTDGIYSMTIDTSGNGVYTSINPFSREVCINKRSICAIDGAVLFTSKHGLMIASQKGVESFVDVVNGEVKNCMYGNVEFGSGMRYCLNAIEHYMLLNQNGFSEEQSIKIVNNEDFRDYLSKAFVSYVSNKKKIIIYRSDRNYCYWIDIATRTTTTLPNNFHFDDNNYPTECYYGINTRYIAENDMQENEDIPCLIQTRAIVLPIPFDSVQRVVIRGRFTNANSKLSNNRYKHAGMYVLGSLDGEHWILLGAKEKPLSKDGFHDFGCRTDRVSVRYIMVFMVGQLDKNSHIDGIELTLTNKYNNKLK